MSGYAHLSHRTARAMIAALLLGVTLLGGCGLSSQPASNGQVIQVVAAENFWGSIAAQVGGDHVRVMSIISDPNADPHSYEPTAQNARAFAGAGYVIINGAGYDPWADKLLQANPVSGRTVLNIGDYLGKHAGDNPHLWYNPDYVTRVVNKIRDDLKAISPANAAALDESAQAFLTTGLSQYHALITTIKANYSRTPVGATESVFSYLAPALDLNLITPSSFLNAVSSGQDVAAADLATMQRQIAQKRIKILVYNSQNTPANIQTIINQARAAGIPTTAITETLAPASDTFQVWQTRQLQDILDALKLATGK